MLLGKAVKVDEILTEKNKMKFEIVLSYANINKKEGVVSPITYQTSNGDFVVVPTYLGVGSSNQDYINYGFSFKYGLSKKLELFSNLNFFTNTTHTNNTLFSTQYEHGFNSLNVGLTYEVKKENDTPFLLIGGSINPVERVLFSKSRKNLNFKSFTLFATSYYTVDPVVFVMNANYRVNRKKRYRDETIHSGNILSVSPSIYFAVNPYTSISWGIKYAFKAKDKINNNIVSNSDSSLSYLFGASYEISSKYTINADFEKKDTNDYSSNTVNFTLSYKF